MNQGEHLQDLAESGIAIIGMAGRFPGARNLDEYWQNLRSGVESVSTFTDEELIASGLAPALLSNPHYIKAGSILEDIDLFDAAFFGYSPREAEIIDPQQRIFLECAWEALENAGYSPEAGRLTGVYAGASSNLYWMNLISNPKTRDLPNLGLGNELTYLTTRVSYKLNLTGPSYPIQTACSTGLVAVHIACQSLLNYECDMALAGSVALKALQKTGYLYTDGGILSPDGHCRAFDAKAQGTIFGSGVGVVVLKRLQDALAERDMILAVVKGSAVNNDGALKASFAAPGVAGQSAVITEALINAEVDVETISYVETHGSGTALGDSIEVQALTQAFRARTDKTGFCAIGSVKTNIGHLDAAAGIAGLLKTVLAMEHGLLPPSLHSENPNPAIHWEQTPFYVNSRLSPWQPHSYPRRAGVSAFGFGGTNAHVILEEAPSRLSSGPSRPWQVLALSAKTPLALETATTNLAQHLRQHDEQSIADVAYTLHLGRRAFDHRRVAICQTREEAIQALTSQDATCLLSDVASAQPHVVFMFSGQGAQQVGMAQEVYAGEPVFRQALDACAEGIRDHLGLDVRTLLYPPPEARDKAAAALNRTGLTQPALFTLSYALAELWQAWGVAPQAMIGHSVGEYVAACRAGVMSLEAALGLVAARGRLMESLPAGAMLSVPLPEAEVRAWLGEELALAAVNAPQRCVVSGSAEAIQRLADQLAPRQVNCQRLVTSHAFHSPMMDPILESFRQCVQQVKLSPPQQPYISNVTGTWITSAQATQADYWVTHLRQTVRFADGIQTLVKQPHTILLEVGPGQTLSSLARLCPDKDGAWQVLASLPHVKDARSDVQFLLQTLGRLWLAGVAVDWAAFYRQERRQRVPLPTYPFERKRYWVEARPDLTSTADLQRPDHPLLDQCILETIGEQVYVTEFHEKRHWILRDHKMLGHALIPGTTFLEMAREAGECYLKEQVNCLKNVEFLIPVIVPESEGKKIQLVLRESGEGLTFQAVSRADQDRQDGGWVVHARGTLSSDKISRPDRYPVQAILETCPIDVNLGSGEMDHSVMYFGPRWHSLKLIRAGEHEAIGYLELKEEFKKDVEQYVLHPALLDQATGFSGLGTQSGFYLPLAYKELHVYGPIPQKCYSYMRAQSGSDRSGEVRQVDVVIMDTAGNVAVDIKGFTVKKVHSPKMTIRELAGQGRIFHSIKWQPAKLETREPSSTGGDLLVFHDEAGMGRKIADEVRQEGRQVIEVKFGAAYEHTGPDKFVIRTDAQDYARLAKAITGCPISQILYLSAVHPFECTDLERLERAQQLGVYSLFHLVKALLQHQFSLDQTDLILVANGVNQVTQQESQIKPENACLFGLGKALIQECKGVRCKYIDIDEETRAQDIIAEIQYESLPRQVAFRNGSRYVGELRQSNLVRTPDTEIEIRAAGVYLLTGGLGGLGLEIAKYLAAKNPRVQLAFLNRTAIPDRERWDQILQDSQDQGLGKKISAIREIECAGAKVSCYTGDVANPQDVERVIQTLRLEFGKINGIVHAAGVAGDGFIVRKEMDAFQRTLAPKVTGTWLLDRATREDELDFFVMFSSTVALFGAAGQGDYTAANLYLDSFAAYRNQQGRKTVSINWTDWTETGMAFNYGVAPDQGFFKSIHPRDAIEAFDEILNSGVSSVFVGQVNYKAVENLTLEDLVTSQAPVLVAKDILSTLEGTNKRYTPRLLKEQEKLAALAIKGRDDGKYTETEQQLARIWAKELGLEEIGILDNFFDLGGDSLIALRMVASIGKYMHKTVNLPDMFEHLTILDLAEHLDKMSAGQEKESLTATEPTKAFGLSQAQKAVWFLQKLKPQSTEFNLPMWDYVEHEIDIEKLEATVNTLIERHSALRTAFHDLDNRVKQTVLSHFEIKFGVVDLCHEPDQERQVEKLIQEDNQIPFDLSRPLIRGRVFRLGKARYCIYFNFHHIIADGSSTEIFFDDLRAVYRAHVLGNPMDLEPLSLQYVDFVQEQNEWLESQECIEMEKHWLQECAKPLPFLQWPTTGQTGQLSHVVDFVTFHLGSQETRRVKEVAQRLSVTVTMFLLSACYVLLQHLSQQEDLIVGVPFAGRDKKEFEKVIGLFVNLLPIRIRMQGMETFLDLLMQVRSKSLAAYKNSRYPFELLIEKLNPERRWGRNPVFTTTFQFSDFMPPPYQMPQLDVSFAGKEQDGEITLRISFDVNRLSRETVEIMAEHFVAILQNVIEMPDQRLEQIEKMLARSERTRRMMRAKELEALNVAKLRTIERGLIRQSQEDPS